MSRDKNKMVIKDTHNLLFDTCDLIMKQDTCGMVVELWIVVNKAKYSEASLLPHLQPQNIICQRKFCSWTKMSK